MFPMILSACLIGPHAHTMGKFLQLQQLQAHKVSVATLANEIDIQLELVISMTEKHISDLKTIDKVKYGKLIKYSEDQLKEMKRQRR